MSDSYVRLPDHWWCEDHKEMHVGPITSWTMEHRKSLHPAYYIDRGRKGDR